MMVYEMKKTIMSFVLLICIALLAPLSNGGAGTLYTEDLLNRETGSPRTDWYEVEDWEIEFCYSWGGLGRVEEGGIGSMSNTNQYITHNSIATLQAEVHEMVPALEGESLVDAGVYVYEVGWFIQPFNEDDTNYEVYIVRSSGSKELLASGNCNYYNPSRDYYAVESEEKGEYTKAYMKFWNEDEDFELEVPIVGAEEEEEEEDEEE